MSLSDGLVDLRVQPKRRPRGAGYDFRDHPDGEVGICDGPAACPNRARWSICVPNDWPDDSLVHNDVFNWTVEALVCGRHLHLTLDQLSWPMDVVQIYDLASFPEGGC